MRWMMIAAAAAVLSGCGAAVDAAFPPSRHVIEYEGKQYSIYTKYDPAVPGHLIFLKPKTGRLLGNQEEFARKILVEEVSDLVCEKGTRLTMKRGNMWGGIGPARANYIDFEGGWKFFLPCE
mgnify:CR=1 FL=1